MVKPLRLGVSLFFILSSALLIPSGTFSALAAITWQFAGWSAGGAFPQIVPDPNVNGRLYIASDVAGVFSTSDRGTVWAPRTTGLRNLLIPTIAVSNSDPNVLYAATAVSVHRSADAGATWAELSSTRNVITFKRPDNYKVIVVDRLDPNRLYVADKLGQIRVSTDAGATWSFVGGVQYPFGTQTPISALYLSRDGNYLFAGATGGLRRYNRSQNTWATIDMAGNKVVDIVGHGFTETVYCAYGNKIAYTSDFGTTWNYTNAVTASAGYIYRFSVATDTSGNTRILIGWRDNWNGSAYLSTNGGSTWANVERNLTHDVGANPTRVWATGFGWPLSVAIDPFQADTFYLTDFWGVWRTTNSGQSWGEIIRDLPNTIGSDVVVSPNGSLLVGTMDNGLVQSTDGGRTYRALSPKVSSDETAKGHVWRVVASGPSGNHIVATSSPWNYSYNQILVSEDGGLTFTKNRNGLPTTYPLYETVWDKGYPRALAQDPSNPSRIYLGIDGNQGGGFFISNDGGYNWTRSAGQPASLRIYNGLAVDPTAPNRLYWGTIGGGGGVYRSQDSGQTWSKVMTSSYYVFDVAVGPDGTVYAGTDTGGPSLYSSTVGGGNWRLVKKFGATGTCEAVAIDPSNPRRVVVSTLLWGNASSGKIHLSEDAGATWTDITGNLPEGAGASAMTFTPDGQTLYMSRFAGSVYKLEFGAPVSDTVAPTAPTGLAATPATGRVDLAWNASTDNVGVTGYRIYRDGSQVGTSAAVSYADTAVTAGATYSYTVKAVDAAANVSAVSNAVNATVPSGTPQDSEPPSIPANVATAATSSQVTVTWNASTDDVGVALYRVKRNGVELGTTAALTYTDSAVAVGLTYSYSVLAQDAAGHQSAESTVVSVTIPSSVDSTPPSAPAALSATLSGTAASLAWTTATDNVGVTGYKVYSGSTQIGDVTGTSFSHTGLAAGTTYVYTVKTYDAAANLSAASNMASVSVPAVSTAPTAPPNLTASLGTGSVYLSWGASTDDVGVSGYNVYRDGVYQVSRGAATRYYTDTSIVAGTTYVYTVKAYDAANNKSDPSNAVTVAVPSGNAPSAPASLNASYSGTAVNLTWTASAGSVAGYRVYRDGAQIGESGQTSYADAAVTSGATYSYTVTAFDGAGAESDPSNVVPITVSSTDVTPPSAPSGLAGSFASGSVALSWTAATDNVGVVGYNVYRNGQYLSSPTGTSYSDGAVTAGQTYVYTVKAYDLESNLSADSNAVSVTVPDSGGPSQIPTVPQSFTATLSAGKAYLSWSASTDDAGVVGYNLYKNGTYLQTVSTLNYTDAAVTAGSTYTYTVKAYDAQNNMSAASAPATLTIPPAMFFETYWLSNLTSSTATVTWRTNVSGTGSVRYGTSAAALNTYSYDVTGTQSSVKLTGLNSGTTYYYQIVVSNGSGSVTSKVNSFKTVGKKA